MQPLLLLLVWWREGGDCSSKLECGSWVCLVMWRVCNSWCGGCVTYWLRNVESSWEHIIKIRNPSKTHLLITATDDCWCSSFCVGSESWLIKWVWSFQLKNCEQLKNDCNKGISEKLNSSLQQLLLFFAWVIGGRQLQLQSEAKVWLSMWRVGEWWCVGFM